MSSRVYSLLYFLLIFIHGNLFSNDLLDELSKQVDILSVEDAFMVSIDINKNSVNLKWKIAPKHYLYLRDIKTKYNGLDINYHEVNSNKSRYDDAFFGNVLILKDEFEISILIPDMDKSSQNKISVDYRGCAEAGFCYPMETLSFRISDKIL